MTTDPHENGDDKPKRRPPASAAGPAKRRFTVKNSGPPRVVDGQYVSPNGDARPARRQPVADADGAPILSPWADQELDGRPLAPLRWAAGRLLRNIGWFLVMAILIIGVNECLGLITGDTCLMFTITYMLEIVSVAILTAMATDWIHQRRRDPEALLVLAMLRRWSLYPKMVYTSLLVNIAVGLSLLFFVLPGIYIYYRLSLATALVVTEDEWGWSALARSWLYTRTRQLHYLPNLAIPLGLYLLISGIYLGLSLWLLPDSADEPLRSSHFITFDPGVDDIVFIVYAIFVASPLMLLGAITRYRWASYFLPDISADAPSADQDAYLPDLPETDSAQ